MVAEFNKKELRFIKKYAYGVNKQEIIRDLFKDTYNNYDVLKYDIKSKLKEECDIGMILKSYKMELFHIDDYFLIHQQHIAFGTAYNVYLDRRKNTDICHMTLKELYVKVLRCHVEMINSYKSKIQPLTG